MASQLAPRQPVSQLESAISHLQGLLADDDYQGALDGAEPLLVGHPENRDLLLITATALRHLRRTDDALVVLDRLAVSQPRYSQMLKERGLCHVARRDAPRAIADLRAAVAINPALPMAWRMLDALYRMVGDEANSVVAASHLTHLTGLPPPVLRAKLLFGDGEIDVSEMIVREFLLKFGNHPEAMRLLAQIGFARGVLDDAELLYAGVLTLVPDHHDARAEFVETLIERHKFAEASEALADLLARDPANSAYRSQAATIAIGLGDHDTAIAMYRALLAEISDDQPGAAEACADFNLWLGHALKTIGCLPEAIAAYHASIAAAPGFGDAWWSLANLKTYRFDDDQIAAIAAAEANPAATDFNRINLGFALGKALEDRGEHRASWDAYLRSNTLQRAQGSYRADVFETNTREQKRVCTPAFFAARSGWGDPAPDPIFVLGLPRSGSTLIEQILASHSQVEGTQELPDIHRIVHDLQGREINLNSPRYPAVLPDLDADTVRRLGEKYMAGTRIHRALGRPFFVDKMPNNFRHVGLIHLILPNATIIDARRNPMDCCFSNFKQLFARGQEFTYGIEDIARYYRTYLDLMRHWDAALPGRVLRVINEDLIDDPEGQIRRLLNHCHLPFETSCLNFHQNRRSVRTPSSEQVRRPISRDGVDQWQPFAQWLTPLSDALGDALLTWRN